MTATGTYSVPTTYQGPPEYADMNHDDPDERYHAPP